MAFLSAGHLSERDLLRFLHSKNVRANCGECDTNDWNFLGLDGSARPSLALAGPFGLVSGGSNVPCIALVCSNCGYTRLFNFAIVTAWVERTPG